MSPATIRCDSRDRDVSIRTVLACAFPALLLATACLLPFLNKAFINDDPHFLTMARQIVKSPLHPMDYDLCWVKPALCAKAYELTPGNTLMGYALVPIVLTAPAERMAHITQLVFVGVAVLAMTALILRMGWSRRHAITGALLLVAIPPLLPMASTAMPDVLALAIGLIGMERLAAWKEKRKWHQGAAAALALGLAGIARPHLALLVPLGAFFLMDSTKPREILLQIRQSLGLWVPVVAAGLILVAAILATREHGLVLNPPASSRGGHLRMNLRSYLLFLCFPLPLAACWAAARWITGPSRIVLTILVATAIALLVGDKQLALALIGGYVLADLLWEAWKNRDREELLLGLWLLVPLPVTYYMQFPIKYLLPCLPAVILLCFRLASAVPARVAHTASIFLIIGGIAYSLLILRADAESADYGRDAITALIRPHVLAGEKVWFPNQYSANWYAPLAGGELVVPGMREPKRGDLLTVGSSGGIDMLEKFPNRTLVQAVTHRYRFGRTMGEGAGLYANDLGNWLWTFRNSGNDRYELWRLD